MANNLPPGMNLPKGLTINDLRNWTSIKHKENYYRPTGNPLKNLLNGLGGREYKEALSRKNAFLRRTGLTQARMNQLHAKWWHAINMNRQLVRRLARNFSQN